LIDHSVKNVSRIQAITEGRDGLTLSKFHSAKSHTKAAVNKRQCKWHACPSRELGV